MNVSHKTGKNQRFASCIYDNIPNLHENGWVGGLIHRVWPKVGLRG